MGVFAVFGIVLIVFILTYFSNERTRHEKEAKEKSLNFLGTILIIVGAITLAVLFFSKLFE